MKLIFGYIPAGVHKFSTHLGTTSKFWAPEMWHEASSILRIHIYYVPPYKMLSTWATWRPAFVPACNFAHVPNEHTKRNKFPQGSQMNTRLHSVRTRKTLFFSVTAMITSIPTFTLRIGPHLTIFLRRLIYLSYISSVHRIYLFVSMIFEPFISFIRVYCLYKA